MYIQQAETAYTSFTFVRSGPVAVIARVEADEVLEVSDGRHQAVQLVSQPEIGKVDKKQRRAHHSPLCTKSAYKKCV